MALMLRCGVEKESICGTLNAPTFWFSFKKCLFFTNLVDFKLLSWHPKSRAFAVCYGWPQTHPQQATITTLNSAIQFSFTTVIQPGRMFILGWLFCFVLPQLVWVGIELLPQVEEFKYLDVLFMSEGKMECEVNRRIAAASAVMKVLHWTIVVKRELSQMQSS